MLRGRRWSGLTSARGLRLDKPDESTFEPNREDTRTSSRRPPHRRVLGHELGRSQVVGSPQWQGGCSGRAGGPARLR